MNWDGIDKIILGICIGIALTLILFWKLFPERDKTIEEDKLKGD